MCAKNSSIPFPLYRYKSEVRRLAVNGLPQPYEGCKSGKKYTAAPLNFVQNIYPAAFFINSRESADIPAFLNKNSAHIIYTVEWTVATTSSSVRLLSSASAAIVPASKSSLLPSARLSSMTKLQRELEGNADGLIDLTFGYPDGLQQPWMRALSRVPVRRLQTCNARQLKQEIAAWFACQYSETPARVLLANTACEALAVAISSVVEQAGDEIILFDGCFDPYPSLIRSFKGCPVFAPRFEDGRPDLQSLQSLLTRRTRAVLITHPDNPLGYVYSKQELEMVKEFCDTAGLTLIVDSAFAFVSPYGADTFGPLEAVRKNGSRWILIADTGKVFDLFGVRCGALIAPDGLAGLLQSRLDQLFFRMDALRLNVLALTVGHKLWTQAAEHVNYTVAANYAYLAKHMDTRLRPIRPMAGSLAILEFDGAQTTDKELAETFRRSAGVALVPCSYFVFADSCCGSLRNRLRIALARPPKIIRRAVVNLNAAINDVLAR